VFELEGLEVLGDRLEVQGRGHAVAGLGAQQGGEHPAGAVQAGRVGGAAGEVAGGLDLEHQRLAPGLGGGPPPQRGAVTVEDGQVGAEQLGQRGATRSSIRASKSSPSRHSRSKSELFMAAPGCRQRRLVR
jgi:hypothetical protein